MSIHVILIVRLLEILLFHLVRAAVRGNPHIHARLGIGSDLDALALGAGILTLCYALAPKPADYMQTIGDSYGISQLKIDVTGLRNITEDGRYDASWVKDGKPGDGYASVKNQKVTLLDSTGQQMESKR